MVRMMWEVLKGWTLTDIAVNSAKEVSVYIDTKFRTIVERLLSDEPLQYILGTAPFYGMWFDVSPSVLIPRPETEELVDMIVDSYKSKTDLRVLDIATGSGSIAIALSRNLPFSNVEATDISPEAIGVAKDNAARLKAKVQFRTEDALSAEPVEERRYDIIVSNPPYIARSEAADMDRHVLDHEPDGALFVDDSDPLVFYRSIANFASKALVEGGSLYFEINPLFHSELINFLKNQHVWSQIETKRDIQGKNRFVYATL